MSPLKYVVMKSCTLKQYKQGEVYVGICKRKWEHAYAIYIRIGKPVPNMLPGILMPHQSGKE